MNPYILLAAGAVLVWIITTPEGEGFLSGILGGTPGGTTSSPGATTRPFLTDAQINYYVSGFATHLTNAQGAAAGASAAAPIAAIPIYGQIALGVAALAGYLAVKQSNDTREDREVFATRLGFASLGETMTSTRHGDGTVTNKVTTAADRGSLYSYLDFISEQTGSPIGWDLKNEGLNIIGRKDFTGNVHWMGKVLGLLWSFEPFTFPQ